LRLRALVRGELSWSERSRTVLVLSGCFRCIRQNWPKLKWSGMAAFVAPSCTTFAIAEERLLASRNAVA